MTKPWVFRGLLSLATLLLIFAVAEFWCRASIARRDTEINHGLRMLWNYAYAHKGIPGDCAIRTTPQFCVREYINAEGFRDTAADLSATGSVVFLGDSFVWGFGVEEEHRMGNRYAAITGKKVLNYGAWSAGPQNELAIYMDYVHNKKPSAVYLIWYPNDIQNCMSWVPSIGRDRAGDLNALAQHIGMRRQAPMYWPRGQERTGDKWKPSALAYEIGRSIKAAQRPEVIRWGGVPGSPRIHKQLYDGDSYLLAALTEKVPDIDAAWAMNSISLVALRELCRQIGATFTVVYLPYMDRIQPNDAKAMLDAAHIVVPWEYIDCDLPRNRMAGFCATNAIPFIDTTPALEAGLKFMPDKPMYIPRDGHLTPRGHMVVAWVIARGGYR